MRRTVAAFTVWSMAPLLGAFGCSVDANLVQFPEDATSSGNACTSTAQCSPGETCIGGRCLVGADDGGVTDDGGAGTPEAGTDAGRRDGSPDGNLDASRDANRDTGNGARDATEDSTLGTEAGDDSGEDSGEDTGNGGDDAGLDAADDTGGNTDEDAASDSGVDAGVDAGLDSGIDAGLDSGSDSGTDAAADSTADTGVDARIDSGHADSGPVGIGPGGTECSFPTYVQVSSTNTALWTTMEGASQVIAPPCVSGEDAGPSVFYVFQFSAPVFVYADTFGSSWDTVLYLLSQNCTPILGTTTPEDAVCSDDACGTQQSQLVALLEPGAYVLGLAVKGSAPGTATIHLQYAIAASGTETVLTQGSSAQSGATVGSSGNIQDVGSCIAAGPENGYWWMNCPSDPGGTLTASTCGRVTWESVLETQIPEVAPGYTCELDSCYPGTSLTQTIPAGAGLRTLCIDGETEGAGGSYSMTVTRP